MIATRTSIVRLLLNAGILLLLTAGIPLMLSATAAAQPADGTWRAGTSRVDITPSEFIWMAGYAAREEPAQSTMHPLWVKALALEDASGRRAVLVTSDLLGLPQDLARRISERVEADYGIRREDLMLTSSHTHSGPVVGQALQDVYPLDDEDWSEIAAYTTWLEDRIVASVGDAIEAMEPARLFSGNGVTRFAVNRRNNDAALIHTLTELEGPSDHAVPVLRVQAADGGLLALAFGYACHATVLSGLEWSGDYPGFAQIALEEAHPGATALFFAGAGADQNPLPRRGAPLAEQYGRELAAAVDRVLKEPMNPLDPEMETAYAEIPIGFSSTPTKDELRRVMEEGIGYQSRWAERLLEEMERGAPFPQTYPYPVQVWRLGDQTLVALGGEVVVDYAVSLKRLLGDGTFVVAYANDVMGYIPSVRVLREGGYEGAISQRVYGHAAPWDADLESKIISEVLRQVNEVGAGVAESSFK